MSLWKWLFGGRNEPTRSGYGLDLENPVLCGGGPMGRSVYLDRVRCPSGAPVSYSKVGKVRTQQNARIEICVLECRCGQHRLEVYLDLDHSGPEQPLGAGGWSLAPEASAEVARQYPPCPYCGQPLPTAQAKQCGQCGADWHDPANVVRG
jgi:hypothetical protein